MPDNSAKYTFWGSIIAALIGAVTLIVISNINNNKIHPPKDPELAKAKQVKSKPQQPGKTKKKREPEAGETWTEPVTGMEFVWIQGRCFTMGSESGNENEKPVHKVCLDGFWMGKYEVTNAQYRKYLIDHNSGSYEGKSLNGDTQPVVRVSWNDARDFVEWLTKKDGGAYQFQLPSEAQWEYACRAGSAGKYYFGNDKRRLKEYAWYGKNSSSQTHLVGLKKPNDWKLHDMLGNVWEWCRDVYGKDAYSEHARNNPVYTGSGKYRVLRGGSWFIIQDLARCAYRNWSFPIERYFSIGFRCARTLK